MPLTPLPPERPVINAYWDQPEIHSHNAGEAGKFITGFSYNSELGRGTALDPGMEIMRKPFSLASLAAKVHELVALAPV